MKRLKFVSPLFWGFFVLNVFVLLITSIVQYLWGPKLKLCDEGVIPDFLGVSIAVNLGLSFSFVRNVMLKPLRKKIMEMRNAAMIQLADRKLQHPKLDRDLDNIEQSNNNQCHDYSRFISKAGYIWAIGGVLALVFEFWIKMIGAVNIVFLTPALYFYICFGRHYFSILGQLKRCLKCVDDLETAETMKQKALESIQGE